LLTEYTVVDPREGKVDRLRRVASESLKQCGRLWLLDIGEPVSLRPLLVDLKARGIQIVVGHAGGVMTAPVAAEVALLIGPEGGWSAGELAVFASQGVSMRGFGVHTMRIETAAVVASAMLVALGGR
jgi:16S rRNA (uracil1498-N3)-methyltransferase